MRNFLCILGLMGYLSLAQAQDSVSVLNPIMVQQVTTEEVEDTLVSVRADELPDLRLRLQELRREYTVPRPLNKRLLKWMMRDELQMAPEALTLIQQFRQPARPFGDDVTFRDTIIVNRLFMPALFTGEYLPDDLTFYDPHPERPAYTPAPLYKPDSIFTDYVREKRIAEGAYRYIERNHPSYFRYSTRDFPKNAFEQTTVHKAITEDFPLIVTRDVNFKDVEAPKKFIPERRYWTSSFESSIQFAQNYISPNWHKGGNSSLNLNNREYLVYNYQKDRIKLTNELEIKNNVYTAPNDTLRNYKVSDDVFRLHSNFGYEAFSKWYYTLDMEFKTQILSSYDENSDVKKAGLLAPYSINIGLGMKYDLNKTFEKKHKSVTFNVNVAPFSYTFRQTVDKDIKLDAHFQAKEDGTYPTKENKLGSTINATLNFQFNRNVSWYSRFYYNTSYHRIEGEWENRFTFAWSRFFSTNITLNLRYDDGVAKNEDFDSYLQINELLSFGFNYKW